MGSLIFRTVLGGAAALLGWAIWEPSAPNLGDPRWEAWERSLFATVGALVGLAMGAYAGLLQGGAWRTVRGALIGAGLGPIGVVVAHGAANAIVHRLFGENAFNPVTQDVQMVILARMIAIGVIGAGLGVAIGSSTLRFNRAMYGLVGGALGGIASGMLFDIVGSMFAPVALMSRGIEIAGGEAVQGEVGAFPRALTFAILGAAIALFIGLVERVARSAWLRQSVGRNEGREWPLYGGQTVIGRGERADVPIFGDLAVAPIHAVVTQTPSGYVLSDAQSGMPTYLNGAPVVSAQLAHGSQIQVGGTLLHFQLRGGPAPVRVVDPRPAVPAPQIAQQPAVISLVAVDGPLVGLRYPIASPIDVGREIGPIPIGFDSSASRRHASLGPTADGLAIADLGSTNGTFHNGIRVTSVNATRGDLVRIGATTFRIE